MSRPAEYLIVGGGTAGCVLARRLVERGHGVHLLEAGGEYPRLALGPPLPGMRQGTRHSWRYFTTQQEHLAHRRLSLPVGRVLGGSSSVNAMMYSRGCPADYDAWEAAGNPGWSYAALQPCFERAEAGPLTVSGPRFRAPFSEAFLRACEGLGIARTLTRDGVAREGCGYFPLTQRRGERVSTARAYLAPVRGNPRLTVTTGVQAARVLLEGHRAVGVEGLRDGRPRLWLAGREVILCAGALNSPHLLMLSGIGPAAQLREAGIEPRVDLPGVGANLQDHPRVPLLYLSGRGSPGDMRHWPLAAAHYALLRGGVMASNCCEAGAFLRSDGRLEWPDLQFVTHFQSALYPGTVDLQVCLVSVASRGRLTLNPADPAAAPSIDPNYLSAPEDTAALCAGLRWGRLLAETPALRSFPLLEEIMPGAGVTSGAALTRYLRAAAETCYHPAGTCRMGVGADAVVAPDLTVHGVAGLRVADASIMPRLVRGNTLGPVVAIAERAADLLLCPGGD